MTFIEGFYGALTMVVAAWLANITVFIGTVWMTVVATRQSISWGLLVFFIPLVGPVMFACKFWAVAKNSFYTYMVGWGFAALAVFIFILRALLATFFLPAPTEM